MRGESFNQGGAYGRLLDRLGPPSRPETTHGWTSTALLKKQVVFVVQFTTMDIIGPQSPADAERIIRNRVDRPFGVGGGLSGSCA